MPKKLTKNEGSIKFSSQGFNYPILNQNKVQKLEYKPVPGDIVLFPSSLFHGTVPFNSKDERLVIAFDVRPKNDSKYADN